MGRLENLQNRVKGVISAKGGMVAVPYSVAVKMVNAALAKAGAPSAKLERIGGRGVFQPLVMGGGIYFLLRLDEAERLAELDWEREPGGWA